LLRPRRRRGRRRHHLRSRPRLGAGLGDDGDRYLDVGLKLVVVIENLVEVLVF
jgi:hypothetical protein